MSFDASDPFDFWQSQKDIPIMTPDEAMEYCFVAINLFPLSALLPCNPLNIWVAPEQRDMFIAPNEVIVPLLAPLDEHFNYNGMLLIIKHVSWILSREQVENVITRLSDQQRSNIVRTEHSIYI